MLASAGRDAPGSREIQFLESSTLISSILIRAGNIGPLLGVITSLRSTNKRFRISHVYTYIWTSQYMSLMHRAFSYRPLLFLCLCVFLSFSIFLSLASARLKDSIHFQCTAMNSVKELREGQKARYCVALSCFIMLYRYVAFPPTQFSLWQMLSQAAPFLRFPSFYLHLCLKPRLTDYSQCFNVVLRLSRTHHASRQRVFFFFNL